MYSPQKQITKPGKLLDSKGRLRESGWSDSMLLEYDRNDVPAGRRIRLKEWDYYLFGNDRYQIALTIADNGYMGMVSASFIDLEEKWDVTNSAMTFMPMGRYDMPKTTNHGDIVYRSKAVSLNFSRSQLSRHLTFKYNNFSDARSLYACIDLYPTCDKSLVVAIPFKENKNAFYYNHKINCLRAEGKVIFGEKTVEFSGDEAYGCLDWGRGIWPYDGSWVWCSCSGIVDGKVFGLNLGKGFGIRNEFGENVLYYDSRQYKLGELKISIPSDFKHREWVFSGEDGDVELRMTPTFERFADPGALGIIKSEQHQVFGKYYGKLTLREPDGSSSVLELNGVTGFSEFVRNKW